jgi:APA family basic amino acid/polyamine antiporter
MVMAGPRVYAAMAADRALPRQLGQYNKRGVPTIAVAVQGALGIVGVLVGHIDVLMRFAGFTLAMFAALTVGTLFVLRARGMRGPYRTIGYPVTPIVFILVSAWIAYAQMKRHPVESLIAAGVLLVGGLIYRFAVPPLPPRTLEDPPKLPEARVLDE